MSQEHFFQSSHHQSLRFLHPPQHADPELHLCFIAHRTSKATNGACNWSLRILALTCPSPCSSASASDLPKAALQLSLGAGCTQIRAQADMFMLQSPFFLAIPRLSIEEEQVGANRWHILVVSSEQAQYRHWACRCRLLTCFSTWFILRQVRCLRPRSQRRRYRQCTPDCCIQDPG